MTSSFRSLLKQTNFLKLWGSQLLSQITVNLLNFVLILKIFEMTGSTVAISLFWFFWAIPAIFLGPFSGTLIDFWGTRNILILANLFQALVVLFYLPAKDFIWPIYSILFLYSLLNQFYLPAEAATMPGVVPKKLLPTANSLFLFTVYFSLVLGFGLAGPIVRLFGYRMPFIIGSILLILAAISVWSLPIEAFFKAKIRNKNLVFSEFIKKMTEGYNFIKSQPTVLFPLLLLVFSQIIISMLAVLSPALVVKILEMSLIRASEILILPAGLGAMVGMFLTVRLLKKIRKRYLINAGLFLSSIVLFILVLAVPQLTGLAKIISQLVVGFLAGLGLSIFIIPTQTLLQEKTPIGLRGRVFGVLGFMITLSAVVPVLFAATVGEILGELWMVLILAIIIFILGIISLKGENVVYRFYRS